MATTFEPRREYGLSHMGNVFVHHFESEDGDRYEVRAGNHTVNVNDSLEGAEAVAFALTGTVPQPKPQEAVSSPPKNIRSAPKAARRPK